VAGDVDPDAIARALDALLEGWSGAAEPLAPVPRPADADRPRLLLLDRPGSAQAVVRVGHVGIDRLDPAYHDLLLLNQVLGGQFTSRLNEKLREEKGFTYGVRSHFDVRRGAGPFAVSASVQSDRVAEALDDIRLEIEALLGDRPPSVAELDDARRALIEGQSRHFETPTSLVARYANLLIHGLPPEEHALFPERLVAVTRDSIMEVAPRHLRPGSFVAVVVADASTVADSLNQLGWAPVELVDDADDRRPR
jgi:predicted Zn-dependent peptidase